MDIDQGHFREQLLPILKHIAKAKFVTFDFEMSGINAKPKYGGSDRSHDIGKPSLQQQYEETKIVAETFQVLQVGITCVEEDRDREFYLARPFNFFLSPLHADGVDFKMDRRFEFSSSACDFLHRNSFDFGKVFNAGVPYLSKQEETEVRQREAERADEQSKIPDIVLLPGSPEFDFYRDAKDTISAWVNDPKSSRSWVNISGDKPLNGFQRRLIYQLVRAEFPGYRTFGRNDGSFMQVVKIDPEEEVKRYINIQNQMNKKICKQIGMRWIFEALSNGDLDDIPVDWFCDDNNKKPEGEREVVKLSLECVKKELKNKDHVLVGHNLFMDLVFLYKTFFGPLPAKVADFQDLIHTLFPTVLDTKYLYTEGANTMSNRANLKEILEPLTKIHTPLVVLHEDHISYGVKLGKDHEAGYDSWMTAEVFVKLSAKLYAERNHIIGDSDSESGEPPDYSDSSNSGEDDDFGGALIDESNPNNNGFKTPMGDDLPPAWHERQLQRGRNRFATLTDLGETLPDGPPESKSKQWIPRWESSFWNIYFNKLRVNAADTGVCDLSGDNDDE